MSAVAELMYSRTGCPTDIIHGAISPVLIKILKFCFFFFFLTDLS